MYVCNRVNKGCHFDTSPTIDNKYKTSIPFTPSFPRLTEQVT